MEVGRRWDGRGGGLRFGGFKGEKGGEGLRGKEGGV